MSARTTPPFRAEHVGSLLRPAELVTARQRWRAGEISAADLRVIEDRQIRDVVARQENIGLPVVTDGELRRDYWHLDFLSGFDGVELWDARRSQSFSGGEQPPLARAVDKVRRSRGIMTEHLAYLRSIATAMPKISIPGPAMFHLRAGREAVDATVYPDLGEFWADLTAGYRQEIAAYHALGCRYLQIDDVSFAYLCDGKMRQSMVDRGDDPLELTRLYAQLINDAIAGRPDDMTVGVHMCRGNFKSTWVAEGGYEPVAEIIFNTMRNDAFFLEYDSDRAGGFEPLRFLPKDKFVVLGLVTSKTPQLESKDALKRRIDEAARHVDLDRLCLSPQCGFSSTHHGNALTPDDQWRKLALVVETARDVWG